MFGPKSSDAPPHELISGREFRVLQVLANLAAHLNLPYQPLPPVARR
ncbi:hypothetical protein BJG93_36465 (plasmid) [Paraburkholderia sprentiae WSM5005]|uniref:Uncharacterized protein n=1 Tax=Paraburkholderia sprentiae WSM5005 TaxID=754502 RepID=A0A8F4QIS7_9BURK|nr:hypothetical protein BJG93_36465 [Paraburkholderia sprentiae WSM5005]